MHKAFGSNVVLNGVSFDVMPGETVCILGRSGVGKSVSLHEIMGFLKPDRGGSGSPTKTSPTMARQTWSASARR